MSGVDAPRMCGNPECTKPAQVKAYTVGQTPRYCSLKCKRRAGYLRNPAPYKARTRFYATEKPWVRLVVYGLTMPEAREWWSRRSDGCAICGNTDRPHLDHCHTSGKVRGWVCQWCNTGMGQFHENPARLRAAADYLENHGAAG